MFIKKMLGKLLDVNNRWERGKKKERGENVLLYYPDIAFARNINSRCHNGAGSYFLILILYGAFTPKQYLLYLILVT